MLLYVGWRVIMNTKVVVKNIFREKESDKRTKLIESLIKEQLKRNQYTRKI